MGFCDMIDLILKQGFLLKILTFSLLRGNFYCLLITFANSLDPDQSSTYFTEGIQLPLEGSIPVFIRKTIAL